MCCWRPFPNGEEKVKTEREEGRMDGDHVLQDLVES